MKKIKKTVLFNEPVVSKPQAGFMEGIFKHPYFILIILIVACFGRTIFFEFLGYDDQMFIVKNEKIIRDFTNVSKVFSQGIWSFIHFASPYDYYRPFLILSLMIDAQIGGISPVVYHISNLLYHIIACLLVYRLFIGLNIKSRTSLILTSLFAVHPIVTQAIAWIPGRNDTLLTIFILASFLNFIKYLKSERIFFLFLHFVFFFLGLLTKETAVLLPVICMLYFAFFLQKKIFSKRAIIFAGGWVLITLVYFYLRTSAIGKTGGEFTFQVLFQTITYRLPAIVQYTGKIILPVNLSVTPTQNDTSYLPGILSILIIVISIFLSKEKNYKQMLLGGAWFILFLVPVLSVPKLMNDNILEHRAYLPLIGMLIILNDSFLFKNKLSVGRIGLFTGITVISLFFFISFNHCKNFKTAFIFWQNAALNSPGDAAAQLGFGAQYFIGGDKINSEIYFNKALELKANIKEANSGLAVIYAEKGEFDKAEKYYKSEIAVGTNNIEVFKGLGSVLMNLKKENEAILCFGKSLELDSTDNTSNLNLGILYFNKQNYVAAEKIWERVIRLTPNQPRIRESLAILYSRTGDYEKAITYAIAEEEVGGKMPEGFVKTMKEQLKTR